jgi:predicted N-acyltransferase
VSELRSNDYVIRIYDDPALINATLWNALLAMQAQPTLFMRHEYLAALHSSGSATARTGWSPRYLTLWSGAQLCAAAPMYLKQHSYGEYVFDWAWADAYERHGLPYYPKLLVAVPFTPVPGSRLLAIDAPARTALAHAVRDHAREIRASSVHILFHDADDRAALPDSSWMMRQNVQFHWDRASSGEPDTFEAFLSRLQREKRKKISQERRKVAAAGVRFSVRAGRDIGPADWDFFYRCYVNTYRLHRSTPYLSRQFFRSMAQTMPDPWLLFIAQRDEVPIATSLIAVDSQRRCAYGRYWGAVEHVDCLHFEACYYQPLQWCIDNGYRRFEGGAQGEHKMARGLLPVRTHSSHWLDHPAFAQAVDQYLQAEGQGIDAYVDELSDRDPFKREA